MPMSDNFKERLLPNLEQIAEHFGTPFHIYDEAGILETGRQLREAFADIDGFQEYYAVKSLPNLKILELMKQMGFGFDCSSIPELTMSRQVGAEPREIMFTSNNTAPHEFAEAMKAGGCILNLDDISLLDKVPAPFPELICFRYNPGPRRTGNIIIGNPVEAKYGVTHEQVVDAYRRARDKGATRFGLHTMVASNERDYSYMVETARMLLEVAALVERELEIRFEFLNIGGGFGIPYHPDDNALDVASMSREITALFDAFKQEHGYAPAMVMESGRWMTGPHGALVTRAINNKDTYRKYVGVDACMSSLMRPALYDAYHHIDVLGGGDRPTETVDVAGSLCENNDKFAVQRELPQVNEGDLLIIHDTGAHGHAMGFQYNGRLRPQELLLRTNGNIELIRRAETDEDYFATQKFEANEFNPG